MDFLGRRKPVLEHLERGQAQCQDAVGNGRLANFIDAPRDR